MKHVDIDEPTSFLDHKNIHLGCTRRESKQNETVIEECEKMFESRVSAGATENYQDGRNLTQKLSHGLTTWKDMRKSHAKKCVEGYCGLANKKTEQLYTFFNALLG